MNESRQQQIERLGELIKDVRIAMFTTQRSDGRLVSRPVATQEVEFEGDLWFATAADSPKAREIAANPMVNVAYASPTSNVYISVAGRASLVHDPAKVAQLWSPAMKLYFPNGKDDPNLVLVKVQVESAEYWDGPGGAFGKALYFVLAAVNDDPGALTENGLLDLRHG
jgi:general stress protein 26